jgi:hypothetical protein
MATVAGLLAATGVAATANAAPIPVSTANWILAMNQRTFVQKLFNDCLDPGNRLVERVGIPVSGSFDPATNTAAIRSSGYAFRVDNFNAHAGAIEIGSLSLKLSGHAATVTGRINRTHTAYSRFGPARPLLRIKRMTFENGPFQRQGKDVPDTFVIGGSGRATILPALARELTRIRCRGPHVVTSRPLRAGMKFGVVTLQLRPDVASGIGGTFEIGSMELSGYDAAADQDATATATPTAPARQSGKAIRWDLPADLRTPLVCEASYNCEPAIGAQLPLGGGFTFTWGSRTTTVANLAAAYEDFNGAPNLVVTGTLDGSPATVFRGFDPTTDFEERVGAALGLIDVRIRTGVTAVHFATTALP